MFDKNVVLGKGGGAVVFRSHKVEIRLRRQTKQPRGDTLEVLYAFALAVAVVIAGACEWWAVGCRWKTEGGGGMMPVGLPE